MGPAFGREFFGSLTRDYSPTIKVLYCGSLRESAGVCGPDVGFPIMTSRLVTRVAWLLEGTLGSFEIVAIVGGHVVCLATARSNDCQRGYVLGSLSEGLHLEQSMLCSSCAMRDWEVVKFYDVSFRMKTNLTN
jgi:hypothetical protein